MRKISLSLVILGCVGLYLWLSGDDATDPGSQTPVATSAPTSAGSALPRPTVQPRASQPPRTWDQQNAYQQPPSQQYPDSTYGVYPTPEAYGPQQTFPPGYTYRPLSQREKAKLEQAAAAARPMVPPAARRATPPDYGGGPSPGYPAGGYAASDYPDTGFPSTGYPGTWDRPVAPTPSYKFRDFDPDEAAKRWTGDYSLPPRSTPPAAPDHSSPYAPGWSPPLPYQRGAVPDDRHLWAAEGMIR